MCDWCKAYGVDGQRWYLNPRVYARQLYRLEHGERQATGSGLWGGGNISRADGPENLERMKARVGDPAKYEQLRKEVRFSALDQVITLGEAQALLDLAWPIGVCTCQCRREWRNLPEEENFSCIGLGPGMYKWERWPNTYRGGVVFATPEEAKEAAALMVKKGFVIRVTTGMGGGATAYACELCFCSYPSCGGLRVTRDYRANMVRKGHYVSKVNMERCNDCGRCYGACQFGALQRDPVLRKAAINMFWCWGCGVCKESCARGAITQVERASVPAVANLWYGAREG